MKIKLSTPIRNKMRKDIEEINGFTLAETKKWSDKEVVEYYGFSMKNSLFKDTIGTDGKPMFPKHFKPYGQRKTDQMAATLKQAGYRVA